MITTICIYAALCKSVMSYIHRVYIGIPKYSIIMLSCKTYVLIYCMFFHFLVLNAINAKTYSRPWSIVIDTLVNFHYGGQLFIQITKGTQPASYDKFDAFQIFWSGSLSNPK